MSKPQFKPGTKVQFKPEWQDEGDENFDRIIIENYGDGHVSVGTKIPAVAIVDRVRETVPVHMLYEVDDNA